MANTHSLDLESGSSQYVSIADASQTGLDITGDLTVEQWIRFETLQDCFFANKWGTAGNLGWVLNYIHSTTSLSFTVSSNGSTSTTKSVTWAPVVNYWYHVVAVYDASAGEVDFYVNGQQQGTTQTGLPTSINNNNQPFVIGINYNGGSGNNEFDGLIDEVRIWNTERTQSDIQDNMYVEISGSSSGLQGYWKFNNDYTDETSNNNDLTASGSPVFSTKTPNIIEDFEAYADTTGINGQGLWTDTNPHFVVNSSPVYEGSRGLKSNNPGSFLLAYKTIPRHTSGIFSIRVRRDNTGDFTRAMRLNEGATALFLIDMNNSPTTNIYFYHGNGSGGGTGTNLSASSSANTWYQCEIQIDSTTNRGRARLDGGTWTDWYNAIADVSFSYVDRIYVGHDQIHNAYWDYLTWEDPSVAYTITADAGSFALTGNDITTNSDFNIPVSVGAFVLTGFDAIIGKGYGIICDVGSFIVTGSTATLRSVFSMTLSSGSFVFTGIDNTLKFVGTMIASMGSFLTSFKDFIVHGRGNWVWTNSSKNTTSWTNKSKNTTSWTNISKSG